MIFVFKTSVATPEEAERLSPLLDTLMTDDHTWNFDLEDCDRILKITGHSHHAEKVICLLNEHGFTCEELPD